MHVFYDLYKNTWERFYDSVDSSPLISSWAPSSQHKKFNAISLGWQTLWDREHGGWLPKQHGFFSPGQLLQSLNCPFERSLFNAWKECLFLLLFYHGLLATSFNKTYFHMFLTFQNVNLLSGHICHSLNISFFHFYF